MNNLRGRGALIALGLALLLFLGFILGFTSWIAPDGSTPGASESDLGLDGPEPLLVSTVTPTERSPESTRARKGAEMDPNTGPNRVQELRVHVVAASTQESVPDIELLVIEDGEPAGTKVTGPDGRALVRTSSGPGRLELSVRDAGRAWPSYWPEPWDVTASLAIGEVEISVPIGPTYTLEFSEELPPQVRTTIRLTDAAEPLITSLGMSPRRRANGQVWVRFGPEVLDNLVTLGPEWKVRVETSAGWAGEATVRDVAGIHPGVLEIDGVRTGSIQGTLSTSRGRPIPGQQVELVRGGRRVRAVQCDSEARFVMDGLEPGFYKLCSRFGLLPRLCIPIEIRAGEELGQGLVFPVPDAAGILSGTLSTQSGTRGPDGFVGLTSTHGGFPATARLNWSELSPGQASFSVVAVSPGAYTLEFTFDSFVQIVGGNKQQVIGPGDAGEFILEDGAKSRNFKVLAFDSITGKTVREYSAWLSVNELTRNSHTTGGSLMFNSVPLAHACQWLIEAPGYQPLRGDDCTFSQDGEAVLVTAELTPGWGKVLYAMDEGGRPVVGVAVLSDGIELGRTTHSGSVLLRARERPASLLIHARGWTLTKMSDVSPEDGTFTEVHAYINLVLKAAN
jgi:hypothetical protein